MGQVNNHGRASSVIMVVCAVIMVGSTLFPYIFSTGKLTGAAEASAILTQENQGKIVVLQITLGKLETQMTQISEDIVEIKQDIKKLRACN